MIIETWEAPTGSGFTLLFVPEQNSSAPVKIELTDEDEGEQVVFLSLSDFKSAVKAMLRFDEAVSEAVEPSA